MINTFTLYIYTLSVRVREAVWLSGHYGSRRCSPCFLSTHPPSYALSPPLWTEQCWPNFWAMAPTFSSHSGSGPICTRMHLHMGSNQERKHGCSAREAPLWPADPWGHTGNGWVSVASLLEGEPVNRSPACFQARGSHCSPAWSAHRSGRERELQEGDPLWVKPCLIFLQPGHMGYKHFMFTSPQKSL